MIRDLVDEAVAAGARRWRACEVLGLTVRTLERWGAADDDGRHGPNAEPANKLSDTERRKLVAIATSAEFRDRSPSQIVPLLADRGEYIASESTFYRVLRDEDMQHHRGRSRLPVSRPHEHVADGPWQVASWDITYLRSLVRGLFFYLYLVEDVWSRKILGWAVHDDESSDHAAALVERIRAEGGPSVDLRGWVLHADNGGPMKGATMLATLQRLGVVPSFSRPSVSDDNPYIESLFRTLKYCPEYPSSGFESVEQARLWVTRFVAWYNFSHQHSGIGFVTPAARHAGDDIAILAARRDTYARARARHPERWSQHTRAWNRPATVTLNPENHAIAKMAASMRRRS
jgi:transposase InsO family protein